MEAVGYSRHLFLQIFGVEMSQEPQETFQMSLNTSRLIKP